MVLNIVELIENNPITKLSSDYNVKILTKIKEQFHPKHLYHFLEDNNVSEDDSESLDKFLKQWS